MSSTIRVTRICQYCNQEFTAQTILTRYCSHTCNRKDYKQRKRQEKLESIYEANNKAIPQIPLNPPNLLSQLARIMYESNPPKKQFLSIVEACILIGITEVTLRRWIKAGIIKTHRIGKKHLIERELINQMLDI